MTVVAALILGPTPWALADQTITTQPYYASSGIKALHAQGLDGSGIKIAIIDGPVDTSVPELRGVKVITESFCDLKYAPASIAHATNIAAILASPDYGWAPKATILDYTIPGSPDPPAGMTLSEFASGCPMDSVDPGFLINQALNDGADVISLSFGLGNGMAESSVIANALTRAMNLQVPVIVAAGNESTTIDWSGLAGGSTVLSVGALDGTGKKASYSNYGAGLSLMAYGGPPLSVRDPDSKGHLTVITKDRWGTSLAAPMVAGALALAMQKWPDATGNQFERVLLDTADGAADHQATWTPEMGYGTLNAKLLVATDPAGYSTDKPDLNKNPLAHPNADEIRTYNNGLVDPLFTTGDNDYVYKGCDTEVLNRQLEGAQYDPSGCQTPTPIPTATTPPVTPTQPPATQQAIPWVAIGGGAAALVVIGAAIAIALSVRRKNRPQPQQPATPYPNHIY